MIDYLNNMLRHLFMSRVEALRPAARRSVLDRQVRFQPPDEDWRTYVQNLQHNALNVYLFDLRENRKLRSNARERQPQNGLITETPAPRRVDCHYLITAWSPANVAQQVEPTLDEQVLLYDAIGVLMNNDPLNPSRIYPQNSTPLNNVPEIIRNADLPTTILPSEGFPKLAEFWGTMGAGNRWKPAVYLIVTLPVILRSETAGYMVTTRITEYRQCSQPETAEVRIQIGGRVLDVTVDPPVPVPNAWVRLETRSDEPLQTTETNELGRFTFEQLRPGEYQLNWRATGHPAPVEPRPITVPSPTGEYDLKFE